MSSLEQFLDIHVKEKYECFSLAGDASARKYYRVITRSTSYIACDDSNKDNFNRFIEAQKYLNNRSLPVPKLYSIDKEKGFLLLEDLKDDSLAAVMFANHKEQWSYYAKAIDIIGRLVNIEQTPSHFFFQWKFDEMKFLEELQMADRYFYQRYLGAKGYETLLFFEELNRELLSQPYTLVHRDFHSRNLHIKEDDLVMIDFQDARLGPYSYDLVSLLEDPYYVVPNDVQKIMKDYFFEHYSPVKDKKQFESDYNLVAIQRLYKILGSFTYLYYEKNKIGYLPYIGLTVSRLNQFLKCSSLQNGESFRQNVLANYYES